MKKRLAFVSSSIGYSEGMLPVAAAMERSGFEIYWISFRGYERHLLLRSGIEESRILDTLESFDGRVPEERQAKALATLEDGRPPLVNDIVLMDRMLRRKDRDFAYSYLAYVQDVVTSFLEKHEIDVVSGGRDSALQIACAKICARLGIPFIIPTVVRLPDDRYGFCLGHTESSFLRLREVDEEHRRQARAFLKAFRESKPVSRIAILEKKNNQFLRRIPTDVRLFASALREGLFERGNDFTRYSMGRLLSMYVTRRVNAATVRLAPPFEPLGAKPFLVYAYQMQPESSVDVLSSFVSNQPEVIRQVARAIPASHELYVKPHPDHVGGLSRREMLAIRRIPGVRLISPHVSSHELLGKAAAVVTCTGTMAFEAALYNVPSIIFAPQFFRALPGVHFCRAALDLPAIVAEVLSRPRVDHDEEIVDFLAHQYANSFVGRVSPYMSPFSETEVDGLLGAYETVCRVLFERTRVADQQTACV